MPLATRTETVQTTATPNATARRKSVVNCQWRPAKLRHAANLAWVLAAGLRSFVDRVQLG